MPFEKGFGNNDLSQLFSLQKLDVDHAIGKILIFAIFATAIGP